MTTQTMSKQLQGLMFCAVALSLNACQQTQIVFTPSEPPSLAHFETPNSLAHSLPSSLNNHLPKSGVIIPVTDEIFTDEVHTELDLPYQLHRLASLQINSSVSNRVRLSPVSPQFPSNNADF